MAVMWAYFIKETIAVAKAAALFVEKEENVGDKRKKRNCII